MIDGRYIRIKVAVTTNNVNVVRIFARRSCVCCRSSIRCVSQSNVDGRRPDEIEKFLMEECELSMDDVVDNERC